VARTLGSSWLGVAFSGLLALSCGKSSREQGVDATAGRSGGAASGGTGGAAGSEAGGQLGSAGDATTPMGGEGGDAGVGPVPTRSSVNLEGSPIYTRVQRLTNAEWDNAVADLLRLDAPARLSENFIAPIAGITDFTNNEKLLFVDRQFAIDYEAAAEAAAALATGSPEALATLYAGTDATGFIEAFGRRAFRRPLDAAEIAKFEELFALGEMLYGAGFENGAAVVIRGMLESPHFLYRMERGPAGEPLDGYEIAAKLSFFLLDTTPSDALLDRAGAGELDSAEAAESLARELLEDPRALSVMRDFHGQLHELGFLASISKPGVPGYTEALNAELSDASLSFFDRVFQQGGGLRDILTSTVGFVGSGLAPLYGVEAPASGGLEPMDLGPEREGWFQQAPFSILWSVGEQPHPIRRGLALHTNVLCAALPLPSDETPALPPPSSDGLTNRERIAEFSASCGGECHARFIDPLGFAFEHLDGMGRLRTTDNGKPVDTAGTYPFAEGTQDFANANDLLQILAQSPQAHTCYAKKVTSYALQRDVIENDRPLLEALAVVSNEQSLKELILALVREPAFRVREEGTP
jgi:hypothetical protein